MFIAWQLARASLECLKIDSQDYPATQCNLLKKLQTSLLAYILVSFVPTANQKCGTKKKFWLPQEESNLRPSDSVPWC